MRWATRSSSRCRCRRCSRSASAKTKPCSSATTGSFPGFELLRDFFAFPNKFIGFKLQGLRTLLSQIDAPAFDVLFECRCRAAPACVDRQPEDVFALYRCRHQSVRDELQPRAGAPRRTRTPHRSGSQPRAGVRSASHHRCLRALSLAEGKDPRLSALQPAHRERARVGGAVLHQPPIAAPPNLAGAPRPARAAAMQEANSSCRSPSRRGSTRPNVCASSASAVLCPTGISPTSCPSAKPARTSS